MWTITLGYELSQWGWSSSSSPPLLSPTSLHCHHYDHHHYNHHNEHKNTGITTIITIIMSIIVIVNLLFTFITIKITTTVYHHHHMITDILTTIIKAVGFATLTIIITIVIIIITLYQQHNHHHHFYHHIIINRERWTKSELLHVQIWTEIIHEHHNSIIWINNKAYFPVTLIWKVSFSFLFFFH